MKDNLQVVLITVGLFVAGLLVGVWTQRTRPFPPVPIEPLGEFWGPHAMGLGGHFHPPPPWWFFGHDPQTLDPEKVYQQLEILRPEIEEFRRKVGVIQDDFRNNLSAMLNPQQRVNFNTMMETRKHFPHGPLPGCAGEIGHPFIPMIIYRPMYDRLSRNLQLNESQQKKFKELLINRRNRMLALMDETPPPSLKLGAVFADAMEPRGQPQR